MLGNIGLRTNWIITVYGHSHAKVRNVSPSKIMENRYFEIIFHSEDLRPKILIHMYLGTLDTYRYNYDFIRYSLRLNIDTFVTFCYKVAYLSQTFNF